MRGTQRNADLRNPSVRFIPAYAGNTERIALFFFLRSVHPRVCGEHEHRVASIRPDDGSSPRMRGTPRRRLRRRLSDRFIPAYAGNTINRRASRIRKPVHPRVCGEHTIHRRVTAERNGSSPRMRGTRWERLDRNNVTRFIPAYAGNTPDRPAEFQQDPVHPRVCGEHHRNRAARDAHHGSSPRMRGTPESRRWPPMPNAVHPRVCGEHLPESCKLAAKDGSSPRMRGTRPMHIEIVACARFIPAYAGNTPLGSRREPARSVHPRVCGEHRYLDRAIPKATGSSPRMRGTHRTGVPAFGCQRFIPAYAGNTNSGRQARYESAVHPRVCGEHASPPNRLISASGSSPRMRGTPPCCNGKDSFRRFIPAYAGNTS